MKTGRTSGPKSLPALALHHRRDERAFDFLQPLLETLTRDKGIAWLGTSGDRWQWWTHDVETNAWLLRALVATHPDSELVPELMAGLAVHRANGVIWDSTRDSALAVAALAEACRAQKVNQLELPVRVQIDDEPPSDMTLSWTNVVAGEAVLVRRQQPLVPGEHAIRVSSPQAASLFYGLEVRLLQKGEQAVGSPELHLSRAYSRVDRRTGQMGERLAEGADLAVGDVVEVELRVTNKNPLSYLAFEDPMPGGFVPYQLYGRWDTLYGHREARIGKTTLFTDWLRPGEHTLRYRVRAESPGTFRALPASVFDMYHPEIRANTTGVGISVRPGP